MLFTNITGKKETKGFNEALVIACPTPGEFRITPMAAAQLGIKDGDSGLILLHPEDNTRVFLAKGRTGEVQRDENGAIVKDKRGRTVYVEGSQFGAVVRTASEGSVLLKLTGAAGWNAVGGNEEMNKEFTLAEGVEGGVPTGEKDANGDDVIHTTTFFELIFKAERPKMKRVKGEAGESVEAAYEADEVGADYEEEEV